jgi:hypothetical protein
MITEYTTMLMVILFILKYIFSGVSPSSVFLSRPEVANSSFGRGYRLSDWDFCLSSVSTGESQHSIVQ